MCVCVRVFFLLMRPSHVRHNDSADDQVVGRSRGRLNTKRARARRAVCPPHATAADCLRKPVKRHT